MVGATITATEVLPNVGKKLIYFTVTTDGSADADFSAYERVEWINAQVVSSGVDDAVAANTAGGDVRFTSTTTAISGIAIVVVASS